MFTDRFWTLKVLAALAALVLLGHDLERRTSTAEPSPQEILLEPAAHLNEPVWIGPWKVTVTSPDGFTVARKRVRVQVLAKGLIRPKPGDWVRVRGRWWEGGLVRADEVRVSPDYSWRRAVIYGYSIAVLAFLLLLVSRRFEWRWRPPLLAVKRAPGPRDV